MLDYLLIIKLVITFGLSLVFGLERQRAHKPVGFGTFTFVSLGACALGILAVSKYVENGFVLLGAIVTGIGFLGAGALIKNTDRVFGFTTAAAIWVFAIIGLSVGIGQYELAGVLYVLVWVVVLSDKVLEHFGIGSYQKKVCIVTKINVRESDVRVVFEKLGVSYRLLSMSVDKNEKSSKMVCLVEGSRESLNITLKEILALEGIISCSVE